MTYEELVSVWTLNQRIEEEQSKLSDLKLLAESITQPITGLPKSKNQTSKVEKIALKIVVTEQRLKALREETIMAKEKLFLEINGLNLPSILRSVLVCRYVACLPFSAIAMRLGYTRRYVAKLHERALQMMQRQINSD